LFRLSFWYRLGNGIDLYYRFIEGVANLRDNGFAEGAFWRLFEPAEEAKIVKVPVLAGNSLTDFGNAFEADDAAVGGVFLPCSDFVEGVLKNLTL
jgi:hypothetical protein